MITASNGVQYDYDALDQRVAIFGGSHAGETIYFAGVPIALHNPISGAYTDLIYANGQMIAEVAGTQTATPTYRLPDHLGSLAAGCPIQALFALSGREFMWHNPMPYSSRGPSTRL